MATRSSRQEAVQRPTYPHLSTVPVTLPSTPSSSTPSSAFNSSSSLSAYPTMRSSNPLNTAHYSTHSQQPTYASSAPLPSPLGQQSSHYFGSIASSSTGASGHAHQVHNQAAASVQATTRQANGSQSQVQQQHVGQRGGEGGAPETAPFLNNFNLVAEAAKRAQMACLMRDLGDVEL